ncbi:MAG: hypothetical protein MUO76_16720, partial [Anaerolineaceae bacterium]|nr:hypothetical protein [Anaerolineaceae bacterium]
MTQSHMQRSTFKIIPIKVILFLACQCFCAGCITREFESEGTDVFLQEIGTEVVESGCDDCTSKIPTKITPRVIYYQTMDSENPFNLEETKEVTPTAIDTSSFEPAGCRKPGDSYELVVGSHWTLNKRTFEMLVYAKDLYNGEIDIIGSAITQGSYSSSEKASFGTHSGGGAVDLSVMR